MIASNSHVEANDFPIAQSFPIWTTHQSRRKASRLKPLRPPSKGIQGDLDIGSRRKQSAISNHSTRLKDLKLPMQCSSLRDKDECTGQLLSRQMLPCCLLELMKCRRSYCYRHEDSDPVETFTTAANHPRRHTKGWIESDELYCRLAVATSGR